ncbi:MAG: hypothetical protein N3A62_06405 [Thermodesulfovibrionales bacterium]|nr:hypothetical protein [Thermodesulfovibrionales bacterium]
MKTITISRFEDIIDVLRENPQWREEMRALILSEELLTLPTKFDYFVTHEFVPLKKKVDKIESDVEILKQDVEILKQDVEILKQDVEILKQDVAILKQDVEVLKQDVTILKKDVQGLKVDVASLKGESFELKIRDRAATFFGKLLRRTKVITGEKLVDILDDAVEAKKISDTERDDVLNIDVVVKGKMKDSGKDIILVGEISVTVDIEDVERAKTRSEILARAYNQEAIGVVVGKEITEKARQVANEMAVLVL